MFFVQRERERRLGLVGIGVAWLVVGAGNLAYRGTNEEISGTTFLGVMFILSGIAVLSFVEKPGRFTRFFLGGLMSVFSLSLRAAFILYAQWLQQDPNLVWITLIQASLHGVLFFLFWWFWQNEVKPWHHYHAHRVTLESQQSDPPADPPGSSGVAA